MKIYTKTGDDGSTSLWSGKRVAKNHSRLEAYGNLDELNSLIGLLLAEMQSSKEIKEHSKKELVQIQNLLFLMGSYISCDERELARSLPAFQDLHVENLEKWIDKMEEALPKIKNFILPGGSKEASLCHLARCVCRRSERALVNCRDEIISKEDISVYLNRLSDYFFVLARYSNQNKQIEDVIWTSK